MRSVIYKEFGDGVDLQRGQRVSLTSSGGTGKLQLPVGGVFGLDDIMQAVRASRRPGRGGKILLRP